ncbi:uncharacterized protein EV154DRAFT_482863 [Mucor mucedo]|uniref:uncharacterized protein n=1 Tax=Mucor mucedo TaxID=29922 RepID=UPI00221E60CE|nr:uncharacterized protein EV154DRAFT_482860 [Mucor mucedo]XP_051456163.1 uncharacterized protein EV154DRAFT_482863 [Mucor mucedo]KAI7889745.1 hypothetical protein EV154DRAFT_482860 [Mucor mucedo]KAI7889747.1 hypothetical protein EV154DRAFT_482863 [Mucor mucedo]
MTLNIILIPGGQNLLAVYGHLSTFYIRRPNFNVLAKFQLNTKIKNEFVNSTYMEIFCVPIYITQQGRTSIRNVSNISGKLISSIYYSIMLIFNLVHVWLFFYAIDAFTVDSSFVKKKNLYKLQHVFSELNHFYPVHEEQITGIVNYKALVIAKFD